MSDKIYIGARAGELVTGITPLPVSRVNLAVDSEHIYTAGDDAGRTLELSCPWGSQAMADDILVAAKAHRYTPYTAKDTLLDPAAELGDAVTVGGVYSTIVSRDIDYNAASAPTISAPGVDEIEEEYPYETQAKRNERRQFAKTRSLIKKTSTEILLQVENQISGLDTSIKLELGKITQRVQDAEGTIEVTVSTLDGLTVEDNSGVVKIKGGMVTADGLRVNAANIDGLLTANQINATGLKVDAANITGTLVIGQLPSTVAQKSEIPDRISDLFDDSDFVNERGVTTIVKGTVTTDYVNALGIYARELMGQTVSLMNSRTTVGSIEIVDTSTGYGVSLNTVQGGIKLESGRGNIYLAASTGQFLQLGQDGLCQLGGGPLVVSKDSYGTRLPSSGTYGQVFFLLE